MKLPARIKHLLPLIKKKYSGTFKWHPNAHEPVNNCSDAVRVRGIKPYEELKSILLKLRSGFYLFHLRGNEEINEKNVNAIHRKHFGNKTKIRLARWEEMKRFNVQKGTVNPLLKELWPVTHIVSPTLFQQKIVYTNDGELDGYVCFQPQLILESKYHIVDDFIVADNSSKLSRAGSLGGDNET